MFLATTALLLQFLAIPGHAAPATTAAAAHSSSAEVVAAQPQSAPTPQSAPEILSAAAEPQPNVSYAPGRTALEPIAPVSPAESSSFIGTPSPAVYAAAAEKERRWELHQKRVWMTLNVVQSGAATLDAWSTRRVISSGVGQVLNPMLRPFAGNGSLYVAIQVAPLVLDYVGRRMMMSHNTWLRRAWWVPQAAGTAMSLAGGMNNLVVASAR